MYVLVVLACLPAPSLAPPMCQEVEFGHRYERQESCEQAALTLPEPWAVMYPEWQVREIQCRAVPEPEEEAS